MNIAIDSNEFVNEYQTNQSTTKILQKLQFRYNLGPNRDSASLNRLTGILEFLSAL